MLEVTQCWMKGRYQHKEYSVFWEYTSTNGLHVIHYGGMPHAEWIESSYEIRHKIGEFINEKIKQ